MANEKSIDEQIAELEAKKKEEERKANFQEFPKHVKVGEQTFEAKDAEHEKALLGGKAQGEVVKVSEPATEPPPAPAAKPAEEPAAEKGIAEGTVAEALALISAASSKKELNALERAESKREGGPRVGVEHAIEKRRAELENS